MNYTFLFVGFGLCDPYVMNLLREVLGVFGGGLRSSYALMKQGEADTAKLWKDHNVTVLEFADYGLPQQQVLAELSACACQSEAAGGGRSPRDGHQRPPLLPAAYLQWLQGQCESVELLGLRDKQGRAVQLNQVYVPLATAAASEKESELDGTSPRRAAEIDLLVGRPFQADRDGTERRPTMVAVPAARTHSPASATGVARPAIAIRLRPAGDRQVNVLPLDVLPGVHASHALAADRLRRTSMWKLFPNRFAAGCPCWSACGTCGRTCPVPRAAKRCRSTAGKKRCNAGSSGPHPAG